MKRIFFLFVFQLSLSFLWGQAVVYPTHWWTGFSDQHLNLIIRGEDVGTFSSASIRQSGVKLERIRKASSKNYLFLDLLIPNSL